MKNALFLSIIVTFFLLHFENVRVAIFGIPIYVVEIGVIVSTTLLFTEKRREKLSHNGKTTPQEEGYGAAKIFGILQAPWLGAFLLLLGVISSIAVALSKNTPCPLSPEGLLRALGILKSWFIFPMLFGWILSRVSEEYFSRKNILFAFLVSFLPIIILSSLGWIFGSAMTYDERFRGIFNSPNAFAMHLAPAVILSWYFLRFRISQHSFPLLHLSFFTLAILLFLTQSISAWIAVAVAIFFFECAIRIARGKTITRYIIVVLACAGIGLLSQWNAPRFKNFLDPDSRSSFASRLMIWRSAGAMIADSPLFGIGPGNFQSCYLSYQRHFPPYLEWSVPEPHNIFLAFWLGSGLIGLLAFLFLVSWWFRRLVREIKKGGDPSMFLTLAAIMLSILIHGLFDTPYWRLGLSYIFWIVFFLGISSENREVERWKN